MAGEALYYPWTRVRDDSWLKAVALYWPRLYVVAPPNYPRRESPVAASLRQNHGILRDVDPGGYQVQVAEEFVRLIAERADDLVRRYAWLRGFPAELHGLADHGYIDRTVDDDRVTWLHLSKIRRDLVEVLYRHNLAIPSSDGASIALHPRLASVYLTALVDRVAHANALVPVTDRERHHGAMGNWTLETLTRLLLADETDDQTAVTGQDVADMYISLAVVTVVPGGLDHVPVERITQARTELGAEFLAFRAHLDGLNNTFTDLADTSAPEILRDRLDDLFDQNLRQPLDDLERGLRKLRLDPVRAVIGMTSMALPVALEWAPDAVGLPAAVGAGGMVAATIMGSTARARNQGRELRRTPAGYLLGLQRELNPAGVVDGIRRMFRQTTASNQPRQQRP